MYQALYRKWRPRTFDEVVGQEHITETLRRQVLTGHLSHAYLMIGTRGTGKTTCARILAKAVNCEHPVNGNPCNACRFCRGVDDGSLTDVAELDAASNNGVDSVRQLRDEAVFSPAEAKRRVYIIDEVHMLSTSAFNALLKILEEPPEHLMFILATTELQKVPATILSRCQRHAFKRLDPEAITGRLKYVAEQERIDLTDEAAKLIAGLSEGGMRDALSMLDQCAGRERIDPETVYSALGLAGNREIAALLGHVARHESGKAVELFARLWQNGKDPATLLGELSGLLRDLLMTAVAPKGGRALRSGGYDDAILEAFRGAFSTETLIAHIGCIQAALADMRSGQARTVCELCLITLCEPQLSDTLPMLRARLDAVEKKLREGVPLAAAPQPRAPLPETPPPFEEERPPIGEPPPEAFAAPDPEPPVPQDLPVPPEQIPAAPAPVESIPQDEPEAPSPAAPPEPVSNEPLWDRLLPRLGGSFPPGIAAILGDASQVSGTYSGDTLRLSVSNPFAMNMLDRPDTIAKLAACAGSLTGTSVRVVVSEQGKAPSATDAQREDRLAELSKYPFVKFQ